MCGVGRSNQVCSYYFVSLRVIRVRNGFVNLRKCVAGFQGLARDLACATAQAGLPFGTSPQLPFRQSSDLASFRICWGRATGSLTRILALDISPRQLSQVNGVPLLSFTEEAGVFTSDIALNLKELQESTSIDEVMESLRSALHNILTDNANYDSLHMDEEVFCRDRNLWLATRDILTSDVVHSCGIDNVDEIRMPGIWACFHSDSALFCYHALVTGIHLVVLGCESERSGHSRPNAPATEEGQWCALSLQTLH